MRIFNFNKSRPGADHATTSNNTSPMTPPSVMQFSFLEKFKLKADNILVFTGGLSNSNDEIELGKKLTIPATQRHPLFTLEINGPHWQTSHGKSSIAIKFNSPEEREPFANCDFSNEMFYIEK